MSERKLKKKQHAPHLCLISNRYHSSLPWKSPRSSEKSSLPRMAQFQFNSKYEYLEHKLPENRCQQRPRCKPDAKTVCPGCWYNNIRVPFDTLVTLVFQVQRRSASLFRVCEKHWLERKEKDGRANVQKREYRRNGLWMY
jgi:hypothetical protein